MPIEGPADVCLLLEGTYPYVSGGVSSWTHELLRAQSHLKFSLVCILAPGAKLEPRYTVPSNVIEITHITVQNLPRGGMLSSHTTREDLFKELELPLLKLQHSPSLKGLSEIMDAIHRVKHAGSTLLLNSPEAWKTLVRMYSETMGDSSFIDYFWTWRGLLGSAYSLLLGYLPPARMYHTLCTGYAGLLIARAHLETGKPCLLTEHGIYTNERKIEITAAEWLNDEKGLNLNVNRRRYERDLRDFWIDSFSGYAKLCYEACNPIITISEANREMEVADGADPAKLLIIPNGVDVDRFSKIEHKSSGRPTIALIGRVVPIKDIKTYLHAVAIIRETLPNIQAFIMGPTDEDSDYYQECLALVENHKISKSVTFTGKVKIDDYLPQIDVVVLTSISEGQPLVILEAGAAGIPSVCTDVGDCRDLIYGRPNETPPLGAGGAITLLTDPDAVARSVLTLLTNPEHYHRCSVTMKQRVQKYYHKQDQDQAYRDIYEQLLAQSLLEQN